MGGVNECTDRLRTVGRSSSCTVLLLLATRTIGISITE
jgi:hypothetical protein